jgi:thiamine biosynthesis lipoprotein
VIPAPRGALVRAVHPLVELSGPTMGVSWSLKASGGPVSPERLRVAVQDALDTVVAQMSQWEIASDITRFNTAPAGSRHRPPADFARVLGCALEIAQATGGAFDPTLGAVTELWGFGARAWSGNAPAPAPAAEAAAASGYRHLVMEDGAIVQPGNLRLDLSGIAKGYGVDKAAEALRAAGAASFLLEVGGELRGHGLRPDGQPWWVSLESPRPGFRPDLRIALPGWSVATSGDYRRGFEVGGRRYSHTFDPKTGAPIDGGVISATVLDPSCMRADALATALTVMGLETGIAFANRSHLAALLMVEGPDGVTMHASAVWTGLEA